ncbi:MAG: translation initiation factor IF-2 [Buchnera aphidicola (Tetraneura akinire)]
MVDKIQLKFLANEINIPIEIIVQKLNKLGIKKTKNDFITNQEKTYFLNLINKKKIFNDETFTLQQKTRSVINVSSITGKKKIIKVETRKKKMYFKSELQKKLDTTISSCLRNKKNNKTEKKINTKNNVQKKISKERFFLKSKDFKKNNSFCKKNKITTDNFKKEDIMIEKNKKNKFFESSIENKKKKNSFNKQLKDIKINPKSFLKKNDHIKKKKGIVLNISKKKVFNKKNILNIKNNTKENKEKINIPITNQKNKTFEKKKSIILQQKFKKPTSKVNRDVIIRDRMTILELAKKMAVKASEIVKVISKLGKCFSSEKFLNKEILQLVAEEMGHKVIIKSKNNFEKELLKNCLSSNKLKKSRPPVVTIMGHVDHGKTTLLDRIRSTNIVKGESGGITQHIGAYHVNTKNHDSITFLDTPGHAAFTAMRARGAHITDIVVLVVASDDGVKPQTIEAINHAKLAKVPIIVAINKIDKASINIEEIKSQLSNYEIVSEDWGGDNIFVKISAKTGKGINELLSVISLQAEMLELYTFTDGIATGVVVESYLDKGRGPVATVIIKNGKLKKGDVVVCGFEYGRIRAILNENKKLVNSIGASIPVEILGLSGVPNSGDLLTVVKNEKIAKEISIKRKDKIRSKKFQESKEINLENMFKNIKKEGLKELNVILKADCKGSLEAISDSLLKEKDIEKNDVKLNIISSGVGGITETDASLSIASNSVILGFNVRADSSAKRIINLEKLDVRYYSIIYDLLNEVKSACIGKLSPKIKQKIIGLAEVRSIFKSPKYGNIAGCMVINGIIKKNSPVKVLRNNIVIYTGELESLRRFKEDINEIRNNMECGIRIKNYHDVNIKDIIEVYETIKF